MEHVSGTTHNQLAGGTLAHHAATLTIQKTVMEHVSRTMHKQLAGGTHEHHAATLIIRKTLRGNKQEDDKPRGG